MGLLKRALWARTIPVLVGLLAFWIVVGPRVLLPDNIGWLSGGDAAQHYLGWLFFRHSDWSFPLGLNPSYGLVLANSLVYSDSIPLLAFLFKPFSAWLGESFQYFGLWFLLCFVLQAWFGWKIVGLFSRDAWIRGLGCGFFALSQPMVVRLAGHQSLAGHFLVVAALYLALQQPRRHRWLAWGALLAAAALVHAYLLAMVALLWLADLVWLAWNQSLPWRKVALEFALLMATTALTCWQAGYFTVGSGVIAGKYGYYRMNLLSIFDPNGGSYVLRNIPGGAGDYEGFNYLGLGMIVLLVFALVALFRQGGYYGRRLRRYPALVLALLGLTLFAMTHKVGIGPLDFTLPMPEFIIRLSEVFRSSGRMFWPVYYALFAAILFVVIRGYRRTMVIGLLAVMLLVQVVDSGKVLRPIRAHMMKPPSASWDTGLDGPFWDFAARHYGKVKFYPPRNDPPQWMEFGFWAGMHGLGTNMAYLARVSRVASEQARQDAKQRMARGDYAADTLYVLPDKAFARALEHLHSQRDRAARVDGYNLILPGWEQCRACRDIAGLEPVAGKAQLASILGDVVQTRASSEGTKYLVAGWARPEAWGVWSAGKQAVVEAALPAALQPQSLRFALRALIAEGSPAQRVGLEVNGVSVAHWTLRQSKTRQLSVALPEAARRAAQSEGRLRIVFHLPDAVRPKALGINGDTRLLAIGLVSFQVKGTWQPPHGDD